MTLKPNFTKSDFRQTFFENLFCLINSSLILPVLKYFPIFLTYSEFPSHHTKLIVADVEIQATGHSKSQQIPSPHTGIMR